MSDLGLRWGDYAADMAVVANDLEIDDSLETAVIISLFTDRRAEDTDELPVGSPDRRGWWGDAFPASPADRVGSRLWLLGRDKQTPDVLLRAEEYARQALQWLLDDRIAERVVVTAEVTRPGWLGLAIQIDRPRRDAVTYLYNLAWLAQEGRRRDLPAPVPAPVEDASYAPALDFSDPRNAQYIGAGLF